MKRFILYFLIILLTTGCSYVKKTWEKMSLDEWRANALDYTNEAYDKGYINDDERNSMINTINKEYNNQFKFDYKAALDENTCSDALSLEEVNLYRKANLEVEKFQEGYLRSITSLATFWEWDYLTIQKAKQEGIEYSQRAYERIDSLQNLHDTEILSSILYDFDRESLLSIIHHFDDNCDLIYTKNDSVFSLISGNFKRLKSDETENAESEE